MSKLTDIIQKASQSYYQDGTSTLSDAEFDKALEELKTEDPDSPLLTDVGHGYDINKDTTPGARLPHKYGQVVGLEKCHNWDELPDKFLYQLLAISPKLDGLSIVCYFNGKQLDKALTRGSRDGFTGIDVTDKVRIILEKELQVVDSVKDTDAGLRGEIIMSDEMFEHFRTDYPNGLDGKAAPTNPRNSAAGIINRKDWKPDDLKYLDIIFYRVVGFEDHREHQDSTIQNVSDVQHILYKYLKSEYVVPRYFFQMQSNMSTSYPDMSELMTIIQKRLYKVWDDTKLRNYTTDGLVLDIYNDCYVNATTCKVEYEGIAFKFKAESKTTSVTDVIWSLSKTGYMIPRVRVEPIQLSGATVTYASGFNAKYIAEEGICKGAKIELMRSGEVIPDIQKVLYTPAKENPMLLKLPTQCPKCNSKLAWSGVHLECSNIDCPGKGTWDLLVWTNFLAPIDNFGDKLRLKYLRKLIPDDKNMNVRYFMEHFKTYRAEAFTIQDKLFIDMLDKIFNEPVELSDALQALNIPRLGDVTSSKLSTRPDLVYKLMKYELNSAEYQELVNIVGEATACVLRDSHKMSNLKYIWDNINKHEICKDIVKIAITGSLSVPRKKFEAECKPYGFMCGSLTKDCKILVTDNPNSSSDKNKKADKWGIPKMTELEFRNKYLK